MGQGNLYMSHRCGYTQKVLVGTLRAAGFASAVALARSRAPYFDLWDLASKAERSEQDMRDLAR